MGSNMRCAHIKNEIIGQFIDIFQEINYFITIYN